MYTVIFSCFVILLALKMDTVLAQEFNFSRHLVVQPTVYHARTKREISTTRHKEGLHHAEVTIKVNINNEDYVLDLRLNEDLITDNYVISYQKDGKNMQYNPTQEELDHCQYVGSVRDRPNSWAAVSTCHGVRGVIYDGQQMRYIEPAESDNLKSTHYVYSHSDHATGYKCGNSDGISRNSSYDPLPLKQDLIQHENINLARYKREITEVRGPYKSNSDSRYVELVLVADHGIYEDFGSSMTNVHRYLKDIANVINSMYAPLNIFIALVGVVVWNDRNEITISSDSGTTLDNFMEYRRRQLLGKLKIMNDNAHFISSMKFDENVVGKANTGAMCSYQRSGGITYRHHKEVGMVAATTAHEMGHNFGMNHDDLDCKCPGRFCIMRPSTSSEPPVHWSSCSVRMLTHSFDRGLDYCLRNKPKRLFNSPTCGNGFVEVGEDCDCGLFLNKKELNECQACCDPRTCKLRANATCASGECCDTSTCRVKSVGTVCRSAIKECDLPEYCDGNSEFCPKDLFKMDSTPCGNHKEAYCAGGSCKSHTDQCRLLWGSSAKNAVAKCYENNVKADEVGNCGYDRVKLRYTACSPEDALCGRLQCEHFEDIQFGNSRSYAWTLSSERFTLHCHTAHVDVGLSTIDPGLVSDGAKCGDNKMCFNQRCESINSIRSKIAARTTSSVCPSKHPSLDCNGNGICNSDGHCHCLPGFAPLDCALPGAGGSVDSGPASDTRGSRPHENEPTINDNRPTTHFNRPTINVNRPPNTVNRPSININRPTTNVNRPIINVNRPTTNVNRPTTTNVNRPTVSVNRPTIGVNRPTTNFDRPITNINRPTTNVNRPITNVNRPTTNVNRPITAVSRPTTNVNRPTTGFNRPTIGVNQPTNFDRPITNVNRPITNVNRPTNGFNRPITNVNRPTNGFYRPTTNINRPITNVNRPTNGFNRPTTGVNRPTIHFNRPTIDVNRPAIDYNGDSPKCITNCSDVDNFKPSSDHSHRVHYNFMVAMYVIFLGILPLVLLIIFLYCYSRHHTIFCCQSGYKTQHRSFYNKSPSIAIVTSFIHNFFTVWTYDNSGNRTCQQETPCNDSVQNTTSKNIIHSNINTPEIQIIPATLNVKQTTHRKITKEDIGIISHKTGPVKTSLTHENDLSTNVGNSKVTKNVLKPTSRPPPPPVPHLDPKPQVKSKPPIKSKPPVTAIPLVKSKPLVTAVPSIKSNLSISTENTPSSVNSATMGLVSTPNRTLMIARDLERAFASRK